MLENFQLAVIIQQNTRKRLLRVPLHQMLQQDLASNWEDQYSKFVNDIQEIDFNAGYHPEEHECFSLSLVDHTLPGWLAAEDSRTVPSLDAITNNEELFDSIKGIVAFAQGKQGKELILFQNFSRSHVIRPGRFLFLENNTYTSTKSLGLELDKRLSAVYYPSEHKLLFSSFRTVNTFLPLISFYAEASEEEIRKVLSHKLLAPENPDLLASNANQWFRKRFAMLRDSKVLDRFSANEIRSRSGDYGVTINISGDRIVFPADTATAKKLLQFLNEEIFRGAITKTLYETNSKRQAD